MSVFVDTSALLAVVDKEDRFQSIAGEKWLDLLESEERLVTTNYVVLETTALLQSRFGMGSVFHFHEKILPAIGILWVDEGAHRAAVATLLTSGKRRLSLVDCASFETMRSQGIQTAFTFDKHFAEYGFSLL